MLNKLIPRDESFYDMFDDICENIVKGTTLFKRMMEDKKAMTVHAESLSQVEHETDDLVHDLFSKLHKTFITPLDREDIHLLVGKLDDILDLTHVAAMNIIHYKPKKIPQGLMELTDVLVEASIYVKEMISLLRHLNKNSKRIMELTIEINRMENEADTIRRYTMAGVFEKEKNAVEVIKMKDILNYIESATDKCEDVSDIIESFVLENV